MYYFEFGSEKTAQEFIANHYGALPVEGYPQMVQAGRKDVLEVLQRIARPVSEDVFEPPTQQP